MVECLTRVDSGVTVEEKKQEQQPHGFTKAAMIVSHGARVQAKMRRNKEFVKDEVMSS